MNIKALIWLVVGILAISRSKASTNSTGNECLDGPSTEYSGNLSVTASGRQCQRWDMQAPHKPKHIPEDGGHHNYCRNPDGDLSGIWCYTMDPNQRWEHCNITKCPDDSFIIWTSYNSKTDTAGLVKTHADAEVVKRQTDDKGNFNTDLIFRSNDTESFFRAIAADYNGKTLFFGDYKTGYIGTFNMEGGNSERYFEGMGYGVESIACDIVTKNIYISDSTLKWILVTNKSFKYYTPIYKTASEKTYGLAIHYVKRFLIFATTRNSRSKIVKTDLAGKNESILWKHPDVKEVSGITIDYSDDRIYWVDFLGYGSAVISSTLEGTDKKQLYYRGGAIFWGVALYTNYLYVTDMERSSNDDGIQSYSIWILNKKDMSTRRYTIGEDPRAIAVYTDHKELLKESNTTNECERTIGCDHLCLPRSEGTSECACSLGYRLDPVTNRCREDLIDDEFMLLIDEGQGKVFQFPLAEQEDDDLIRYSIVPLEQDNKINTIAYDPASNFIYWSEKKSKTINRANIDGSNKSKIADTFANSMAIDPHTGNLFYSDIENKTIVLSSGDGMRKKTIVRTEKDDFNTTTIMMISLDIQYKYLYWTETFSNEGDGKVMRCKYDGSEKEEVMEGLEWPNVITIDYKTNRLYVAEAVRGKIYATELSDLETINNTSKDRYKKYEVWWYLERPGLNNMDLKIYNDIAYVSNINVNQLMRFHLINTASSIEQYGPLEFYGIPMMALGSRQYYRNYIQPKSNPCEQMSCPYLCVQLSDVEAKCVCEDGEESKNPCSDSKKILSELARLVLEKVLKIFQSPQGR